ncbi:MAG: A24 family peptidase [Rhodobacteraceae bacterium]|jgi:leader peptidase (prepilin peptidase)/N-methyltransferase|nr:A24 family peptidase [Paracoccaceae bacterium]
MLFAALSLTLAIALLAIAVIDLRSFRIPDWLSLPMIMVGVVLAWRVSQHGPVDHAIGALIGFGSFAMIGALHYRKTGIEALGLGDAKLFAAAGAWLGWQALPVVLLLAAVGGLGQVLARDRGKRRDPVAFGPWLALAIWLIWLWPHERVAFS